MSALLSDIVTFLEWAASILYGRAWAALGEFGIERRGDERWRSSGIG